MFNEFAEELVYFCTCLHDSVLSDGGNTVHFFSREGQFLKKIFDEIVAHNRSGLKSKYMKVSRSATFLPSLKSLDNEDFITLFRQYTEISPEEFLKSLGLESSSKNIADQLGYSDEFMCSRIVSFHNNEVFKQIVQCAHFRAVYEDQRIDQKKALVKYFELDSIENESVFVVDVGWKGTIQDHLSRVFSDTNQSRRIKGYYVGLLWPTAVSNISQKHGLIFNRDKTYKSEKFWVFNENRALYELLLSANHGSAKSYTIDPKTGAVDVELQDFIERDQFESIVKPIQDNLMEKIKTLIFDGHAQKITFDRVVKGHERLVFEPLPDEVACFEALFQYENFGLFENTYFLSKQAKLPSSLSLVRGLVSGDDSVFGFWPYIFLKRNYGRFFAELYKTKVKHF